VSNDISLVICEKLVGEKIEEVRRGYLTVKRYAG
jgi:hypothetical protein